MIVPDPPQQTPGGWQWFVEILTRYGDHLYVLIAPALAGLVRSMGITIQSGQTGLLFTFGRTRRTLDPGFHLLIPFVQRARSLPTRSRTMDLPTQRVVTRAGLVFIADANLVYRIVDVRKALIEVDDLERGMLQMLGLGVQEVLRDLRREEATVSVELDEALRANLSRRLEPWGVAVERTGFTSVTPSPRTLRLTQLGEVTHERQRRLFQFEQGGLARARALTLIGGRARAVKRSRHLWRTEWRQRGQRRLRAALQQDGWSTVQIKQAGLRLRERITTGGRLRAAPVAAAPANSSAGKAGNAP